MTKIVLVSGKSQAGKDTVCSYMKSKLDDSEVYHFADYLKEICSNLFNIPMEHINGSNEDKNRLTSVDWKDLPFSLTQTQNVYMKTKNANFYDGSSEKMSIRNVLQVFGSDICRNMDNDCWVNACKSRIERDAPSYALIADARFPNEIDAFPNAIVIRLLRNPLDNKHVSEIALDDYHFEKLKKILILPNSDMTIQSQNETCLAYLKSHD